MYKLIDGNLISKSLLNDLKDKVSKYSLIGRKIKLVDIFVGDNEASKVYIESKKKKFNEIGFEFDLKSFPISISEEELINKIHEFNNDKSVNAIFIELPLPAHFNEKVVIDSIFANKDVEGFSSINLGSLFQGKRAFYPCTAEGIVELIKRSGINISGKHCVVIGRSNIVGKPLSLLMLKEDATVTICHSKTKNLASICREADILIAAIGKPRFIDDSYIKEGAIVIDAGIHRKIVDGTKIICGDVNFEKVAPHTSYITPVPGGVGPMTVTMLIKHCIETIDYE